MKRFNIDIAFSYLALIVLASAAFYGVTQLVEADDRVKAVLAGVTTLLLVKTVLRK